MEGVCSGGKDLQQSEGGSGGGGEGVQVSCRAKRRSLGIWLGMGPFYDAFLQIRRERPHTWSVVDGGRSSIGDGGLATPILLKGRSNQLRPGLGTPIVSLGGVIVGDSDLVHPRSCRRVRGGAHMHGGAEDRLCVCVCKDGPLSVAVVGSVDRRTEWLSVAVLRVGECRRNVTPVWPI